MSRSPASQPESARSPARPESTDAAAAATDAPAAPPASASTPASPPFTPSAPSTPGGPAASTPANAGASAPVPPHLSELKLLHVTQLVEMAVGNGIESASRMRKQDLIFALLKSQAKKGVSIFGDGTLEVLPDGFGFLRSPDTSYLASTDDIYVSPSQIRRFNLHTGDSIEGEIRTPKDGERYFALVKVDRVNSDVPGR